METYRDAAVAYLRRVCDETGLTLNEIAERVGVSHTTLTRPVNSPAYKYAPKFATLQKIAGITGVNLPSELTSATVSASPVLGIGRLPVRGVVAAGMWQQPDFVQSETNDTVPMVEDPTYTGFPQWAELIRGPSMDLEYPDGTYVHVVDAIALGYRPIPGDDVIVERRRNQGGDVERTCKRITRTPDGLGLAGVSREERWNAPIPLASAGDDVVVEIIALVIGSYRPRRR